MARPTDYREKYCKEVILHLKDGKSLTSFAAEIGTHREVLWQWRQKHPLFNNACLVALGLAQKWWENFAMSVATGEVHNPKYKGRFKNHNSGMIMFLMKQRFEDYRHVGKLQEESRKVNVNVSMTSEELDNLSDEELDAKLTIALKLVEEQQKAIEEASGPSSSKTSSKNSKKKTTKKTSKTKRKK